MIDLTVASEMDEEIAPQEAEPGNPLRRPCAICKTIVIDLTVASEMDEDIAPQDAKPANPLRRPCAICRRARS